MEDYFEMEGRRERGRVMCKEEGENGEVDEEGRRKGESIERERE